MLSASLALLLTLAGCAGYPLSAGAATPDATSASAAAAAASESPAESAPPTPAATDAAPASLMSYEQIVAIAQACPAVVAGDPAVAPMPAAQLAQWTVDAMQFFATTADCSEIPVVVARAAAGTEPADMAFSSPLQFIEPPCPGVTTVSFWAHYDDDLIFANPALQEAYDSGGCLRTFFFTGSDAGEGEGSYAGNREKGIRQAYDVLCGVSGKWVDRSVTLRSGLTVTLTRPEGNNRVSLIFVRLPDGGLGANGYKNTGNESLPKLFTGEEATIHTLDTNQEVTLAELNATVPEIANGYAAGAVYAHLPGFAQGSGGDHPDHRTVGRIVAGQVDAGLINPDIVQYAVGYPVAKRPANIGPDALARKLRAFSTYAANDPVIKCKDSQSCLKVHNFGDWLQREYLIAHRDLVRDE